MPCVRKVIRSPAHNLHSQACLHLIRIVIVIVIIVNVIVNSSQYALGLVALDDKGKKLTDVRYHLCSPLFIERRWHDAAFLNCRQLQSLSDSSIAPQALGL